MKPMAMTLTFAAAVAAVFGPLSFAPLATPAFGQERLTVIGGAANESKTAEIKIGTPEFQIQLATDGSHLVQTAFGDPAVVQTVPPPGQRGARPEDFYPTAGNGYIWEPALQIIHADGNTSTDLTYSDSTSKKLDDNSTETRITLKDPKYADTIVLVFRAYSAENVIENWTEVTHSEAGAITVARFASSSPVIKASNPTDVYLSQFRGKYKSEATLEEEKLDWGMKVLDSKLGTRAQYFRNASFLLSVGGPAQEETGDVFGATLEYPGSFQFQFEIENGRLRALAGANPFDSAYRLKAGETFKTPAVAWTFSKNGKGQVSRNFHRWGRKYALRDPGVVRPVLLNNWEATDMNFDDKKIISLFDGAKAANADLFLLDDGWFGNGANARNKDNAGLGDWQPNKAKLPNGVEALAQEAVKRGLRFGIWVEPEMVNPKSDLYTKHPEWIIQQPGRDVQLSRNQCVLDLTRPEVKEFVFKAVDDLLSGAPSVTYIKWDCNRYITQPGSTYLKADEQQNLWIEYNKALIEIMGRVVKNHPKVQMMACAGGGGRVDYSTIRYFDTFWPSDNTDPLPRIKIQWGFDHFFPAAATANHVTRMGNRPLKFAFDVAMSGALGMDMDLSKLSAEEIKFCAAAVTTYKTFADVVINGDLYRLESPYGDASRASVMYVSEDKSKAVVFAWQIKNGSKGALVLKGLDPRRSYHIQEVNRPLDAGKAEEMSLGGAALLKEGITPGVAKQFESAVFVLTAEK